MPTIILHQYEVSPFCNKARKLLNYKRLSFEVKNYHGMLSGKAARLTKEGTLPVMEYDDQMIQDSSDIAAFLEQLHSEPSFYPSDPYEHAQAHFWEDWADESLSWFEAYFRVAYPEAMEKAAVLLCEGRPKYEQPLLKMGFTQLYKLRMWGQGIGRMEKSRIEEKFFNHMQQLNQILSKTPWIVGQQKTIADIAVSAQLAEVVRTSSLKNRLLQLKHIEGWLERTE